MCKNLTVISVLLMSILIMSFVTRIYTDRHPINKMYDLSLIVAADIQGIESCYQVIKFDTESVDENPACIRVAGYIATELNIIYESKKFDRVPMGSTGYYGTTLTILPDSKRSFIERNMTNNYYYYATSLYIATRCPSMVKKHMFDGLKNVMKTGKFDF